MTTAERGVHVDVQEATASPARGYQQPCAVCGRVPSPIRLLSWHPPRGPRGVPAWSVQATYYCEEHRPEAEQIAQSAADR